MKVRELPYWWSRTPEQQAEMDALVAELRRRYPPKPRPVKPDGMSDEDFILSLQTPATQAVLKMSEEELGAHRARPMPENWKARPDAETIEEAINLRNLTPNEIAHVEATRRRPKNSLGDALGSGAGDERKTSAVDAFIFTPPAKVTAKEVNDRAVNLVQYKSEPFREEWVELPWYKALFHRLRGNKIRVDNKK